MDLHQHKNSFDSIIDQHFPKDIQQKRIKKELISLDELDTEFFKVSLQNTTIGLKVIVELSNEFVEMELEDRKNIKLPVAFELLLDSQFPFNLPRLFSRTPVYDPSLADARDFLEATIERPWSPTILLKEVITQIPKLLKKLNNLKRKEDSQLLGQYHPGEIYSLEDLLGLESMTLFTAEEVIDGDGNTAPRYLGIAESFFLRFEPVEKTRNIVKLLSWATVQTIVNVKKSPEEEKSIVLTFMDKDKKSGFNQNKFITNEYQQLSDLVFEMGAKYGTKFSRSLSGEFDITQYTARQTPRNKKEPIEQLLEAITVFEQKIQTDLSKDIVYGLMGLYQKVVEHFATHEDPMYEDFVGRLKDLMEREDIQAALKSDQESQSKKKQARENEVEQEEEKTHPIQRESPTQNKHKREEEEEVSHKGYNIVNQNSDAVLNYEGKKSDKISSPDKGELNRDNKELDDEENNERFENNDREKDQEIMQKSEEDAHPNLFKYNENDQKDEDSERGNNSQEGGQESETQKHQEEHIENREEANERSQEEHRSDQENEGETQDEQENSNENQGEAQS